DARRTCRTTDDAKSRACSGTRRAMPRSAMRSVLVASIVLAVFSACGPSAAVPRCEAKLHPGNLVITEVFADYRASRAGTSSTGFEWFELYNATDHPIDLGGVVLARARLDGSAAKLHAMASRTIAPGGYFVVGDAT